VAERPSLSFAALLRQLRAEAGLTQEELADKAALSARSVSDLERGINVTARKETARLLADALDLTGPARAMFEAAARGQVQAAETPAADTPVGVAAPAGAAAVHALPRDTASFTGRGPELDQLISELEGALDDADTGRVVGVHAIDGMAGIGKTTFAVHAAHVLAPRFPDGQFFLPLHSHTPGQRPADPAAALGTLLLTTGIATKEIPDGLDARTMMWRNGIAGKKVLLVLDDAASHDQVRPLLPGTPGSLVLITSRRRLAALEEATPISLDMLSADEAAELFGRLTSRSAREPEAVAEITRLCGHLPLAIRLIAGTIRRHPSWTVADLAAELAATKDRLAAMRAENLSVAAAFDLSYEPLSPGQRRLFRRLGLNPGTSIDVYAAAALDGTGLAATRRNLDDLYDHHLISEPARGRFRMHDLLGEHARSLSEDDDPADREQAIDRLLDYHLHAATAANQLAARRPPSGAPEIPAPPAGTPQWRTSQEATGWFEAELANLQACAGYAADHDRPLHAVWLPAQLAGFLRTRGYRDEALAMHQRAAAIAGAAGDLAGQAASRTHLGSMYHAIGDYSAAAQSLTAAISLCRELGDRIGIADALVVLGLVEILVDHYAAGSAALIEALDTFRELNDLPGQAVALDYLGGVRYALADYPGSDAALKEALALYRELGDTYGQAEVIYDVGRLNSYRGDYTAAAMALLQAEAMYADLGYRRGQSLAFTDLGIVQRLTGDYEAAAGSITRAMDLHTALGDRHGVATGHSELGILQFHAGNYAAAGKSLALALELLRDVGDGMGEARTLNYIGTLQSETTGGRAGLAHHEEALAVARGIGAVLEEADALAGIGRCHLRMGNDAEGIDHMRQALAIYEKIGAPGAELVRQDLAVLSADVDGYDQPGE